MTPPKEISDRHILLAMKKYGGSFVMRLGDAGLYADTENLKIIKQAFPQIWKCYSEMAKTDLIEFVAAELHKANFESSKTESKDCGGYYCSEEHGHIVRLCIDAGVTEHLEELEQQAKLKGLDV